MRARLGLLRFVPSCVVLAFLAGCASEPVAPPSGTGGKFAGRPSVVEQDLEHAEKLVLAGSPEAALPALDRVLATTDLSAPLTVRALIARADAHLTMGNTAKGVADASRAMVTNKSLRRRDKRAADAAAPEVERVNADCALRMRDFAVARQGYERALATPAALRDPDGAQFKRWLAAIGARDPDAPSLKAALPDPRRSDLLALARDLGLEERSSGSSGGSTATDTPTLPGVTVIPRSAWGARAPNAKTLEPMTRIYRITVHHSGEVTNIGGQTDVANLLRAIQNAHQRGEGYADVGYHFLIDSSGRVWQGRDLKFQGAHAGNGALNAGNVGVCLLGNFDAQSLPAAQAKSLLTVLEALRKQYGVRRENVYGHGEIRKLGGIGGTECPGDRLQSVVERYRRGQS